MGPNETKLPVVLVAICASQKLHEADHCCALSLRCHRRVRNEDEDGYLAPSVVQVKEDSGGENSGGGTDRTKRRTPKRAREAEGDQNEVRALCFLVLQTG